jgi:hypothetical protein
MPAPHTAVVPQNGTSAKIGKVNVA